MSTVATQAIASGENGKGPSEIISVLGVGNVQGQDVIADVLIEVKQGQNANVVAQQALKDLGLKPFDSANLGSDGFTLIGFVWDQTVVQSYNEDDEPASLNGNGLAALEATHAELSDVGTSTFTIASGDPTTRCPSLVKECPGKRFFDQKNDVAWLQLRPGILGSAYFGVDSNGQEEVDVVLSLRFNWHDGCSDVINSYDVQTVFLHENAHVAGLGHSKDPGSVLLANYHGADCNLGTDDIEGLTFLYDDNILGTVSGTITNSDGDAPIEGALVVVEGTSMSALTNDQGDYTISGLPDPVTYTIIASADEFDSSSIRVTVNIATQDDADISLDPEGSGGGGGGGRPVCHPAFGCS